MHSQQGNLNQTESRNQISTCFKQTCSIIFVFPQIRPHQYSVRRVVDLHESYWLVCKRYHCARCDEAGRQATFNTWDPRVLKYYHANVVEQLDVVFTHKCAVSQALADYINDHAVSAASFEAMHRHIKHNHRRKCDRARYQPTAIYNPDTYHKHGIIDNIKCTQPAYMQIHVCSKGACVE